MAFKIMEQKFNLLGTNDEDSHVKNFENLKMLGSTPVEIFSNL